MTPYSPAEPEVTAPEKCPFCASVELTNNNKTATASTYWRCTKCGEIWNAARLQARRVQDRWQR
jgi:transposase-like protein